MRTTTVTAALAAALLATAAAPARAADPTACPLPLSKLSLLGVHAAPDSLGDACDALKGGEGARG